MFSRPLGNENRNGANQSSYLGNWNPMKKCFLVVSVSIPVVVFLRIPVITGTNVRGGNGHRCLDIIWPTGSLSESNNWSTSLDNWEPTLSGCSMADGIAVGVEQLVDEPRQLGDHSVWMFHGRQDRCRSRTIGRRASIKLGVCCPSK